MRLRYPLLAFLIVFVLPPFTAHALLTGKAKMTLEPPFIVFITEAPESVNSRIHHWTLPGATPPNRG